MWTIVRLLFVAIFILFAFPAASVSAPTPSCTFACIHTRTRGCTCHGSCFVASDPTSRCHAPAACPCQCPHMRLKAEYHFLYLILPCPSLRGLLLSRLLLSRLRE